MIVGRRYTSEGHAAYMTAALGVVHNLDDNTQRIYGGGSVTMTQKEDPAADQLTIHRDDIISLGISADRTKIVTGQTGKSPSVHVWDASTGEKIDAF